MGNEYSKNLEALKEKIYFPDEKFTKFYSKIYAFTSANLSNFLPQLLPKDYLKFFKDCLFNQQLSGLEQNNKSFIDSINIKSRIDLSPYFENEKPAIFATFHLGSYRIINSYLIKMGVDFSVLVDDKVFEEQSKDLIENCQSICKLYDKKIDFQVINAEEKSSILKIVRNLKANKHLVVYLDGNSGLQKNNNLNLVKVNFFDKYIYVRKGVAYISHLLHCPIIPVLSYRGSIKGATLHFYDIIRPPIKKDKNYPEDATKYIWGIFESCLLKYLTQWEGWFNLHNWIEITKEKKSFNIEDLKFYRSRFIMFNYCKNEYFLLDKKTYLSIPVDPKYKKYFLDKIGISKNEISDSVIDTIFN